MPLNIKPTVLNSSGVWTTTEQELQELYDSPFTGAVTTRTSLLNGFPHDPAIHQYLYFDARSNGMKNSRSPMANSMLSTLGCSPISLHQYLDMISRIVSSSGQRDTRKPFIVSVSGTADDVAQCHKLISHSPAAASVRLLMEVNLLCPHISDKPPPVYSALALESYLFALQCPADPVVHSTYVDVEIGIKIPPFTWDGQFAMLIDALLATTAAGMPCPISFITACNTLGSCLVLEEAPQRDYAPGLASPSGIGIGGMAGSALHPLALGNVRTLRMRLDEHAALRGIEIVGVGGVDNYAGYERMRSVGAAAVAVGTAFGRDGVALFEMIANERATIQKMNGII